MTLAALQDEFCAFLKTGDGAVTPRVNEAARRGLAVYRYAFRATLKEALRGSFEKTHAWLGDDAFDAAADVHIEAHAPGSWTLSVYGDGFDATLAARYPNDPEVAELAWLDWKLRRAFDGPDSPELDRGGLAAIDWDHATLKLAPTLTVRSIVSNVAEIWNALAQQTMPPPARRLDQPAGLLVWRQELSPRFMAIPAAEETAIGLAISGMPFGALCGTIAPAFPDEEAAAAFAGAMLGRWIGDGVLVQVTG